jgi:hypothetical protein
MLDFQVLLLSCLDAPLIFAYRKTAVDVYLCCLLLGLNFGVSLSDSNFSNVDFFFHVLLARFLQALRQRFQEEYREVVERHVYTGEIVVFFLRINSNYASLM